MRHAGAAATLTRDVDAMLKHVLVPVDHSMLSGRALMAAATIARAREATIDLLMVHQPTVLDGLMRRPWDPAIWHDEARYLEALALEVTSSFLVPVSRTHLRGDIVKGILDHAATVPADLIVLASHGRTGVRRAWLGSVADGVARYARVPVLLLHAGNVGRRRRPFVAHRILILLDGSLGAMAVLPVSCEIADALGASLELLRVVVPMPFDSDPEATDALARAAQHELELIAVGATTETRRVTAHVVVNASAAQGILAFVRANPIQMVALTSQGPSAWRMLGGSIAGMLLRCSGVPLLTVASDAMTRPDTST